MEKKRRKRAVITAGWRGQPKYYSVIMSGATEEKVMLLSEKMDAGKYDDFKICLLPGSKALLQVKPGLVDADSIERLDLILRRLGLNHEGIVRVDASQIRPIEIAIAGGNAAKHCELANQLEAAGLKDAEVFRKDAKSHILRIRIVGRRAFEKLQEILSGSGMEFREILRQPMLAL